MQMVPDSYYYWYNRFATFISVVLIVASSATLLIPSLKHVGSDFGLSFATLFLAVLQLIYSSLIYRPKARANPWSATLLSAMLLTLTALTIIHNSGQFSSWFMVAWLILGFLSGIFGSYGVVGYSFLITIYFIIEETGPKTNGVIDPAAAASVIATYAVGFIGYMIWRTKFIDQESMRVKQLTGQLRSKEQQAEILIESITDGMIVVTPDGLVSLMNPAAAVMTEWETKEAMGIDVQLVIKFQTEDAKDVDSTENPFAKVFSTKEPVNETLQLIGRNGKQQIVSLVISPVIAHNSDKVNGAVAIIRDISEARAEEKRRADFISTASHEMRTPVAAIEGYLALAMNERVSSIDQKARSYLEKAHSSTQHLGKLFQDLLTSAKAEDGRLVNNPAAIEMGTFLDQLTDSLRFAAEKKGLLLDFMLGVSNHTSNAEKVVKPLYYVHVDPDRLSEVITNLFDNAVKYTETGKITIGLTGNNDVVQLYIKDTGPGIPADDLSHLFQKFYRVDNTTTRTIGGTGLGLFICKKIIELYKGRIWVESTEGSGSTFYINLPRLSTDKANQLIAQSTAQSTTPGPGPA